MCIYSKEILAHDKFRIIRQLEDVDDNVRAQAVTALVGNAIWSCFFTRGGCSFLLGYRWNRERSAVALDSRLARARLERARSRSSGSCVISRRNSRKQFESRTSAEGESGKERRRFSEVRIVAPYTFLGPIRTLYV